jgi:lysozyme
MSALEILLSLIRESEGCRLTAYQDTDGVFTVGWGCTGKGIVKGTVWTQAYADAMLMIRAQKALADALRSSPVLVNEYPSKQAAVADFIYNIGLGSVKLKIDGYLTSTLKKCIDAKDWEAAKIQLRRWVHDAGKVQGGLVTRRKRECALLD